MTRAIQIPPTPTEQWPGYKAPEPPKFVHYRPLCAVHTKTPAAPLDRLRITPSEPAKAPSPPIDLPARLTHPSFREDKPEPLVPPKAPTSFVPTLEAIAAEDKSRPPAWAVDLAARMLHILGVQIGDIRSRRRWPSLTQARGIISAILRTHRVGGVSLSWPDVARVMYGHERPQQHSTCITAAQRLAVTPEDIERAYSLIRQLGLDSGAEARLSVFLEDAATKRYGRFDRAANAEANRRVCVGGVLMLMDAAIAHVIHGAAAAFGVDPDAIVNAPYKERRRKSIRSARAVALVVARTLANPYNGTAWATIGRRVLGGCVNKQAIRSVAWRAVRNTELRVAAFQLMRAIGLPAESFQRFEALVKDAHGAEAQRE